MLQPRQTKICLVGDALSGGGAERVHALLSSYFAGKGIEVHNIIVQDLVSYPFSGQLLNMGKHKRAGLLNRFARLAILSRYLRQHSFDYIIDFRMRRKPLQDLLIAKLVYNAPAIYTVHSAVTRWYMPRQGWLTRLMYGKAYGIVSITKKMQRHIEEQYGLTNVTTIYNPIDPDYIRSQCAGERPVAHDYLLVTGRLNTIKQLDRLIMAYGASQLPDAGVKLLILGDGPEKENLKQLVHDKNLGYSVIFGGFQENPYVYMRHAQFLALSSRQEGLPMVLLEALACGTPVVAFDCFTGPAEIIAHRHNGLLEAKQDFGAFTAAMTEMFTDKALQDHCRANAAASVEQFHLDRIGAQWLDYLQIENTNGHTDN